MFGVRLSRGGKYVFLAADAAYSKRSWQELILPGFGFNPQAQEKALYYLRGLEADPNCLAILPSHDPDTPLDNGIEL